MKRLAHPFVITVSTISLCASGCGKDKPPEDPVEHRNPPDPGPDPKPPPPASIETATTNPPPPIVDTSADDRLRLQDYPRTKNAVDAQKRAIFLAYQGAKCFVELEWPKGKDRMPGEAPPTKDVPCPPEMTKPAWETCRGGTIFAKEKAEECICFHMGNPPPLPKRTTCP